MNNNNREKNWTYPLYGLISNNPDAQTLLCKAVVNTSQSGMLV